VKAYKPVSKKRLASYEEGGSEECSWQILRKKLRSHHSKTVQSCHQISSSHGFCLGVVPTLQKVVIENDRNDRIKVIQLN
jgi:hypothetical protein